MMTPTRYQFDAEDFAKPAQAAQKLNDVLDEVTRQLVAYSARQVVSVSFVAATPLPNIVISLRLDKVAGFNVLQALDGGTLAAPISPGAPVSLGNLAWEKTTQNGVSGYRVLDISGLVAGNRYTLTLEAVGG